MNWKKFSVEPPPNDGNPKLIVWFKGPERQQHLAVAWRSLQELKIDHGFSEDDEMSYWCELTDPVENDKE